MKKKKIIKFFVGVVVIYAIAFATDILTEDSITTPKYEIENEGCNVPDKCFYDIRLQDKVSEVELEIMAQDLKRKAPRVDNVLIMYYLPCMEIGKGAWATSNFTPTLRLYIQDYMLEQNPYCEETKPL